MTRWVEFLATCNCLHSRTNRRRYSQDIGGPLFFIMWTKALHPPINISHFQATTVWHLSMADLLDCEPFVSIWPNFWQEQQDCSMLTRFIKRRSQKSSDSRSSCHRPSHPYPMILYGDSGSGKAIYSVGSNKPSIPRPFFTYGPWPDSNFMAAHLTPNRW